MKILVTFGGTREYIDAVRFITNLSTGGTGRAIAAYLSRKKHEVFCLCAEGVSASPLDPAQNNKNDGVRRFQRPELKNARAP
jgi:phosphopantothenoylcysteine decarboxylase/phosphopantothenate--cysteine ligase